MQTVSPDAALLSGAGHLQSLTLLDRVAAAIRHHSAGVARTDAELVRDALAGSEAAFRELVCRYERPVFSVIVRLLGNPSRAEEVAQDTFVKAFQRLHTYERDRKFGTWLLAIAHHAAVDEIRRARRAPEESVEREPALFVAATTEQPDAAVARVELASAVEKAIRRLRPEYAELVTLRYQQELTLEEIEAITALPIGTIKSYLHRARQELAALLSAAGWRS